MKRAHHPIDRYRDGARDLSVRHSQAFDDDRERPGRRFLHLGADAVLLGRTGGGRYAFIVPTLPRGANDRPVVHTMSVPEATLTLGLARRDVRSSMSRRS